MQIDYDIRANALALDSASFRGYTDRIAARRKSPASRGTAAITADRIAWAGFPGYPAAEKAAAHYGVELRNVLTGPAE